MKKETVKINKAALCFSNAGSAVTLSAKEEGKPRAINMTLYSGKIIKNHWYWGNLAIDVSGVKMAKKTVPILQEHDIDKKIAFGAFGMNDKNELVAMNSTFVETPSSREFQDLSDQGFPFEASLGGRPTKIQRLMENEEAEVNGYTMKGPGTIWRESVIREGSVVTFGYDPHTKSVAMAENEEFDMDVEETKLTENKEDTMDLTKLKAEFPALYEEILLAGKTAAGTEFAAVKKGLEDQITSLTAEKDRLQKDSESTNARLLKLEKITALQEEKAIETQASGIVSTKLKGSKVPERLYSKVRKQLNYQSFVKDGVLDVTSFSAAVDTELKDWVVEGTETETATVLGMSFSKDEAVNTLSDKTVDDMVNRMLKSSGQTIQ